MATDDDDIPSRTVSATGRAEPSASAIDLERGDAFGRYIVLDRLGAGGMGVVYVAYDPDLDRKLAVKILRPDAATQQARLLREGRAMARVQHPNVIAVHDVGTFEHRVFVAMELVDGTTLSGWLDAQKRDWRAIVDAFVQAGRGLAAAHAVGLVHRDFKPANVLVGVDGRVRVVDFGLARSTDDDEPAGAPAEANAASSSWSSLEKITRTGATAGTPTYMSPEQLLGQSVDARSDQFSFSVALYRALFGERPFGGDDMAAIAAEVAAGRLRPPPKSSRVPAWVQKIVLRGLATRADARWPSMDAMLAALERDPDRVRRRWLMAGGAAALLAALAFTHPFARRDALVCRGAERKLAGVWDESRKQSMHAAFAATGRPFAESAFASVAGALDRWGNAFTATHTEACEATRVRHELSDELLDLRMECLGQRLQETKAQVDLFTHADAKVVEQSVRMVSSLASLSSCSDVAALRAPVRPPADQTTRARIEEVRGRLAQAEALNQAGKYKEGLALAEPAVAAARALDYRPLEAAALLLVGRLQILAAYPSDAEKTLEDAALAARAGRDAVAEVEVLGALVKAEYRLARYDQAHLAARRGLAAYEALGGGGEAGLATLLNNLGTVYTVQARYDEALASYQRALTIRERLFGPDHVAVAGVLQGLGFVLGKQARFAEAEVPARRAVAIYEKKYGPDHPAFADSLTGLAYAVNCQGRHEEALALYRRNVAIIERALGPEAAPLALVLTDIGDVLRIEGKYDEALVANRRSLAISEKARGVDHPDVALALNNMADVLRLQGKWDEALADYQRAQAIWEKQLGPQHPDVAIALTGIGRTELGRRAPSKALPPLERADAIREAHPTDPAELQETRFALAQALWDGGDDRARARDLAERARAGYAQQKATSELAEVEGWLARHPSR